VNPWNDLREEMSPYFDRQLKHWLNALLKPKPPTTRERVVLSSASLKKPTVAAKYL
jgi:predicted nucleotide-binding protein